MARHARAARGLIVAIASPCTGLCRMDEASDLCRGCRRTLDEIARWGTASDRERRAILARLAGRRG